MRRLGRLPHDPKALAAVPQFTPSGTLPEFRVDWSRDVAPGTWGMYGNDTLADCTDAAAAHAIITWGAYAPPLTFPTQADVNALFAATGTPEGAVCLDVLDYWVATGFGATGKLRGYQRVDPTDWVAVMSALTAFGGLYVGLNLHEDNLAGPVWDVSDSPVEGGHCVWVVEADTDGVTCISWGVPQRMTRAFWEANTDECYALRGAHWPPAGWAPGSIPTS